MNEFYHKCHLLNVRIMSLLATALGLEASHFEPSIFERNNTLRLLHYPSVARQENKSTQRLGAHTDFGTITLLWQDMSGGLEIQNPDGLWVGVEPQENTMVLNVADLLSRWTNGSQSSSSRLPY